MGRRVRSVLLLILGVAALISLATGLRHALAYQSHDLQWMGGRLLAQHIDPWQEKLNHLPHHYAHFSPPNYLPLLYLFFVPFSSLSFHTVELLWCVVSVLSSIAAVLLLRRIFALDTFRTLLLLFLLWMSSPFRVVLEVGQMSLVELLLFSLIYAVPFAWLAGIAFGLSAVKYSFAPAPAMLFLLRGRVALVLIAAGLGVAGLLGAKALVATPLLELAREPFEVSSTAVSPGVADLMTLAEFTLNTHIDPVRAKTVSSVLALAASFLYVLLLSRYRLSPGAELSLLSLASLLFFKHLIYDYVFLLVPLAYAVSAGRDRVKPAIIAGVLVFWFLAAWVNRASTDVSVDLPALWVNFLLLLALSGCTTLVALRESSAQRVGQAA